MKLDIIAEKHKPATTAAPEANTKRKDVPGLAMALNRLLSLYGHEGNGLPPRMSMSWDFIFRRRRWLQRTRKLEKWYFRMLEKAA